MAYTVALPDGRTVEFPDEVPKDKAAGIIQQQFPELAPKPESSDFVRGFKSYVPQTQEILGGAQALLGASAKKTLGQGAVSDYLLTHGAQNLKDSQAEQAKTAKSSDSLTDAWKQGIGTVLTDWLPYQAGAGAANILESLAASGIGALAGSAVAPGAGTAVGAFEGLVGKTLVKKGIKEAAEKILKAEGKDAATAYIEAQAKKELTTGELAQLAKSGAKAYGTTAGLAAQATGHGLGEVGSRAAETAQEQGKRIEDVDLSRALPAAAGHAVADYIGNKIGLGSLDGLAAPTKSMLLNIAKNVGVTGAKELPPELLQTALERYGSSLPLADQAAIKEYIDTAGAAFGMAALPGTVGGMRAKPTPTTKTVAEQIQEPVVPGAQLPEEAPAGTQGTLFSEDEMGKKVAAPKEEPDTQSANAAPQGEQLGLGLDFQREYADIVKEREALKQQPQTAEVKARIKELSDQLMSLHENEVESIRAEKAQEAEARAKFPGLAETAPIIPRTQASLFSEEEAPTPAEAQAEPTNEAPAEREPKGGYQYKLPLRTVPEGKEPNRALPIPARPTEITMQDLEDIGVHLRTSKKWLEENVVGKTPAEIQVLVANDPSLILRKGSRAEILKYLTAPMPEGYKEPTRVTPTAKTNKPKPVNQPRGGQPSMGVSGEPASTDVVQPGAGVPTPTRAPAALDGLGLAPAGQPASKRTETQRTQPTAVTPNAPTPAAPASSTVAPAAPVEKSTKADKSTPAPTVAKEDKAPPTTKAAEPVKSRYERLLDISNDESIPAATRKQAEKQMDLLDDPTMNASKEDRKGNEDYADRFLARVDGLNSVAIAEGQTLDSLKDEVKNTKGVLGAALRRMVQSGKVVLEDAHPSGKKIGGYYDGSKVTLYANGIPSGQSMAVALHEVGAHLGMERLLGKKQYNAVIDRILDMVAKGDGSTEAKIAQAAYKRIPVSDFKRGAGRDEMVAYFIEEMAKSEAAGTLPKIGPLRTLWNQIKTAILTSLNKALGTKFGLNDMSAQQILEIAKSALVAESKTAVSENVGKTRFSVNPVLLTQSQALIPKSASVMQTIQNAATKIANKDSTVSLATRIRTSLVDPLATVEQRITKNYDQGITDAMGNTTATVVARQAQDITKLMPAFYEDGVLRVNQKTRMLEVAKGAHAPNDIIPVLHDLAKRTNLNFEETYAYASTVLEGMKLNELVKANTSGETDVLIHWRTPDGAIDMPKINAAVAEYNSDPRYKKLSDIMDAPRIELINELEKAGRLTPETAKEWREVTNYVPFDREGDGDAFAAMFSSNKKSSAKGLARLGRLPQLIGSEWRPVKNVFENYYKTMGWLASQLAKQNANSYMMGAMVNAGYASKIHSPKMSKTGSTVTVYKGGEETYYDVASKWDQMAFLDDTGPTPNWVRFMGQVSGVLRTTVTANPIFAASQVLQDVQGALLFSGVKHPLRFISEALGNFGALAWHETVNAYRAARGQAAKTHEIEHNMRRVGLSGAVDYTVSNPAMEELFRQGIRSRTKFGSTTLGAIIHGLEQITHASDLAVRKALYDDEMRNSNDVLLASTKARELINFRRRGGNQWVQHWTTMVPFFNAALQSTDIVYRAITSKADASGLAKKAAREQFIKNTAMFGAAALLYALMRRGDDDYEKMDRRIRDNNWILPGHVRIPIRGDMATLKVAIENGMDYFHRTGTKEELEAAEAIKTALWYAYEQFGGRNLRAPAAIQPLLENFANFSFMTGRAQVGTYQQSKPKHLQEVAGTSETAKAIADFVYKEFNGMEISPVHIDNVLRGYLGTTAATVTTMTDAALYPDKPDRPLHKLAAIGAFAWDETQLNNPKNEFYALQEKVLPPVRAVNELMKNDPTKALEYAKDHQPELMLASAVNSSLKELSKIREYEKYLKGPEAAKSMTPEARDEQLGKAQKYSNQLVEYTRGLRHSLKI